MYPKNDRINDKIKNAPLTNCKRCGKIGIILASLNGMHLNCYTREQKEKNEQIDSKSRPS